MTLKRLRGSKLASIVSGLILGVSTLLLPKESNAGGELQMYNYAPAAEILDNYVRFSQDLSDGAYLANFPPSVETYYEDASNNKYSEANVNLSFSKQYNCPLVFNIAGDPIPDGTTNQIAFGIISSFPTNTLVTANIAMTNGFTTNISDVLAYTIANSNSEGFALINLPNITNAVNGQKYGQVTMRFAPLEQIVASAGANGSITPSGTVWAAYGDSTNWNIQASNNYHISLIQTNGATAVTNDLNSLVFTNFVWNITGTGTIYAAFDINKYTFTANAPHGTPNPSGTTTNEHGAIFTNSIDAFVTNGSTRYVCTGWTMAGNDPVSGTSNSFSMAHTNAAALAWLFNNTQKLFSASSTNGTISGAADGWKDLGTILAITNTPYTNYHQLGFFGDTAGCTTNGNVLTVPMDIGRAIVASNVIDNKTIIATAGSGGIIVPSGTIYVPFGSSTSFVATANSHYHVFTILKNGTCIYSNSANTGIITTNVAFNSVDADGSIQATFASDKCNLTVNSQLDGTSSATTHDYGTTLDKSVSSPIDLGNGLRAVATGFYVTGNNYNSGSSTNVNLTITNLDVIVDFLCKTQALLTVSSPQNGTITGASSGYHDLQTQLELTPDPNSNYRFTRWTGDVPSGSVSNSPLSLVMDQARSIGAVFISETLSAPTGVLASDGAYTSLVAVTWDTIAGAGAYEVWRNSANNAAGAVFLNNVSVTNYTDASDAVRYGTLWYYWVRAVNTVTTGEFSASDSGYAQVSATNAFITGQPVVGDYDGDGLADPALYDLSSGQLYVWLSSPGYARVAPVMSFRIAAGNLPVAGDFDGDRLTDPGVFQRDTGSWYLWLSSAGYYRVGPVLFGLDANDIPVPSDFDGDGKTDPAVYHAADGSWTVWLSEFGYSKAGPITFQAGLTDIPAPGRYERGALADPAVYQPGTGDWYVWLAGAGYGRFGPFSFPTTDAHLVVPADYDGDGLCDPAAYVPSNGVWRIWESGNGYALKELPLR